jgi:hypothetical protein
MRGVIRQMRIEFKVKGELPEDVTVIKTIIPGLDLLWYLMGTDFTLGDLVDATNIEMEADYAGDSVKFVRDTSGRLTWQDAPSTTRDYFRNVAKALGFSFKTMEEESFLGMITIYAKLMRTPVNEAGLQG